VAGEEEVKRLRRHLQESIRRAHSPEYQPKVRRLKGIGAKVRSEIIEHARNKSSIFARRRLGKKY
jgi:hypothetical protein